MASPVEVLDTSVSPKDADVVCPADHWPDTEQGQLGIEPGVDVPVPPAVISREIIEGRVIVIPRRAKKINPAVARLIR